MNDRPPLPPLTKNISPRNDKTLGPQTSRPVPFRKSLHPAPRASLFLNPSLNEYDDPIENRKEYKRLSLLIAQMKKSMIPLNEELFQLQSFLGPATIDQETEDQQQTLENLKKEKELLDEKIASIRRTYSECNYINQQAEIDYLRLKLRRGDVFLQKTESSVDDVKGEYDDISNSDTKAEILESKEKIKELKKNLAKLKKDGDDLMTQYCYKLQEISDGKSNEQKIINNKKSQYNKLEHQYYNKEFELRKMTREHAEKVKALNNNIEFKRKQRKMFNESQNWREKINTNLADNYPDNNNNYDDNPGPYVTVHEIVNPYKVAQPQKTSTSPRHKQSNYESQNQNESSTLNSSDDQNKKVRRKKVRKHNKSNSKEGIDENDTSKDQSAKFDGGLEGISQIGNQLAGSDQKNKENSKDRGENIDDYPTKKASSKTKDSKSSANRKKSKSEENKDNDKNNDADLNKNTLEEISSKISTKINKSKDETNKKNTKGDSNEDKNDISNLNKQISAKLNDSKNIDQSNGEQDYELEDDGPQDIDDDVLEDDDDDNDENDDEQDDDNDNSDDEQDDDDDNIDDGQDDDNDNNEDEQDDDNDNNDDEQDDDNDKSEDKQDNDNDKSDDKQDDDNDNSDDKQDDDNDNSDDKQDDGNDNSDDKQDDDNDNSDDKQDDDNDNDKSDDKQDDDNDNDNDKSDDNQDDDNDNDKNGDEQNDDDNVLSQMSSKIASTLKGDSSNNNNQENPEDNDGECLIITHIDTPKKEFSMPKKHQK